MANTIIIDPCVELQGSYDPGERWRTYGRLILTEDALYYIHGWDVLGRPGLWRLFNPIVRLREPMALDAGEQLLADVADQAMIVPRSRVLPVAELSTATLGRFRSRIVVETRRQGDALGYEIPRRLKADVAEWISRSKLPSSATALERV
jgi:hypothetical protein